MKQEKKSLIKFMGTSTLLLTMFAVAIISGCSRSDDDSAALEDSFTGTWTESKILFNNNEQPIDDCDRQSAFTINSDGTFIESSYYTNSIGSCELEFEDPGTWENLGNNRYRIKYDPDTDGDTFEEVISVNNNTFSVFYDDPYIYVFTKN